MDIIPSCLQTGFNLDGIKNTVIDGNASVMDNNYDTASPFVLFQEVKLDLNTEIEVPVGSLYYIYQITHRLRTNIPPKLVYPIIMNPRFMQFSRKKTPKNVWANLISKEHRYLSKSGVVGGEYYYGNAYMILDSDLEPLTINTLKIKLIPINEDFVEVLICEPAYRVSPKIFTQKTTAISKFVRNIAIPYYISTPFFNRSVEYGHPETIPVPVVIEEFKDKFFVKPNTPNAEYSLLQNEINNLLINSADDIIQQFDNYV